MKKTSWTLFQSSLQLSAFTFGGGYVIVPLMKKKFVDELGWLTEERMLDLAAIAQSAPGAIAVNASILVGYEVFKVKGAFISILGTVLPPLLILTVISWFYAAFSSSRLVAAALMGMQAAIAAILVDVVITMTHSIVHLHRLILLLILVAAFVAACIFKVNVMIVILVAACVGAASKLDEERARKERMRE